MNLQGLNQRRYIIAEDLVEFVVKIPAHCNEPLPEGVTEIYYLLTWFINQNNMKISPQLYK
jgi:hypothetical protein